jgi:hypothetical protein
MTALCRGISFFYYLQIDAAIDGRLNHAGGFSLDASVRNEADDTDIAFISEAPAGRHILA